MRNSTGHATIQAAAEYTQNKYTFGVSIDRSKVFDIIDHYTQPKKLEHYDLKENILNCPNVTYIIEHAVQSN